MTVMKIAERPPGSPVAQTWWHAPGTWSGPPAAYRVPPAYWDTGAITSPWRRQPDRLWFLYNSGQQFLSPIDDPMRSQLRGYQWAGNYNQPFFDPLLIAKGQGAAPVLAPLRQAAAVRTVPMQNELGYQMVYLRDNGVPIGATPASTPNYVVAGPTMIGPMSLAQPIIRGEQVGQGTQPQIPNPTVGCELGEGTGLQPTPAPFCSPPYPACPYGETDGMGAWPPQLAPPGAAVYGMDVGGQPVYARAPTAPAQYPPTFGASNYPLVPYADNPGGVTHGLKGVRTGARAAPNPGERPGGDPWATPPAPGPLRPVGGSTPSATSMAWPHLSQWMLATVGWPSACPQGFELEQLSDGIWACMRPGHAPRYLGDPLSTTLSRLLATLAAQAGYSSPAAFLDAAKRGGARDPNPRRSNPGGVLAGMAVVGAGAAAYFCWPRVVHYEEATGADGSTTAYRIRKHGCRSAEPFEATMLRPVAGRLEPVQTRTFGEPQPAYAYLQSLGAQGSAPAPETNPTRVANPAWPWALGAAVIGGAYVYCRPHEAAREEVEVPGGLRIVRSLRYLGCWVSKPWDATETAAFPDGAATESRHEAFKSKAEANTWLFGTPAPADVPGGDDQTPQTGEPPRVPTPEGFPVTNPAWPWIAAGAVGLGTATAIVACRPRQFFESSTDADGAAVEWLLEHQPCTTDRPYRSVLTVRGPSGAVLFKEQRYFDDKAAADAYGAKSRSALAS